MMTATPLPVAQLQDQDDIIMTHEQNFMTLALQNSLVLHKMLRNLDIPDLNQCRLVNTTWRSMSSKILKKSGRCRISIKFNKNKIFTKSSQLNDDDVNNTQDDLSSLNKILAKSCDFPCQDFAFQDGNLGLDPPQQFFNIYGPQIKSLTLISTKEENSPEFQQTSQLTFKTILSQVSHIEKLILINFGQSWSQENEVEYDLPSLKLFSWSSQVPSKIQKGILMGSPNLTLTLPPDIGGALMVASTGKNWTVQEFLVPADSTVINLIEFSSQLWPQLKKFAMPYLTIQNQSQLNEQQSQLKEAIENMYNCVGNSTENLMVMEFGFFPKMKILPFKKLNGLSVSHFRNNPRQCFPNENLNVTFPHLNCLDLGLLSTEDEDWMMHFPQFEGTLNHVQILKVRDRVTEFWMKKLKLLSPNFQHLVLYCHEEGEIILPKIYKIWNHLEQLEIIVWSCQDFNCDSLFTGMTKEVCLQLKEQGLELQHQQSRKCNDVSICCLKRLKTLRIWFVDKFVDGILPMSILSGVYAFQFMSEDLKLIVEFNHSNYTHEELKAIYESVVYPPSVKVHINISHRKL